MGVKVSSLGTIRIGKSVFDVELNEGTKQEKYDIHIQNEAIKLYFKDAEFSRFAACFIAARKRFAVLKGQKYD